MPEGDPLLQSVMYYHELKEAVLYFFSTLKKLCDKMPRECIKVIRRYRSSRPGNQAIEHVTNDDISHIHSYVTTVKQSEKGRDDYVTLGDLMDKHAEISYAKTLDKDTLKEWTKLAAKSDTMQDFLKSIE